MLARFALVCFFAALALTPASASPPEPAESRQKNAVAIEVKIITMADDFFERIGVDFSTDSKKPENAKPAEPIFLDEKQVGKLLDSIQGDIRSNVMQAPRLVVTNGKTGEIRCTKQYRFVTGVEAIPQGSQFAILPKCEEISTGYELSVRPTILTGKRAVAVDLKAALKSLEDTIPLFPVVLPVTPVGEDGKAGKPVVLTQQIQQPRLTTLALREEMTIPDGGTALFGRWKRLSEGRNEFGPPVLSKIPYINRSFKNVGYTKSMETVLVMVTATIIRQDTEKPAELAREKTISGTIQGIVPCSASKHEVSACEVEKEKKAAKLVQKYHQACAAGLIEEAKRFARRALELDPTCFDGEASR